MKGTNGNGMLSLAFGALAEPIHTQLKLPKEECEQSQKESDAITLLRVQGYLTDEQTRKARQRLLVRIAKIVWARTPDLPAKTLAPRKPSAKI